MHVVVVPEKEIRIHELRIRYPWCRGYLTCWLFPSGRHVAIRADANLSTIIEWGICQWDIRLTTGSTY